MNDRTGGAERGALALLRVGVLLLVLGIVGTTGWWSLGLVGAGLGLLVEAAFLARRGHPPGNALGRLSRARNLRAGGRYRH